MSQVVKFTPRKDSVQAMLEDLLKQAANMSHCIVIVFDRDEEMRVEFVCDKSPLFAWAGAELLHISMEDDE